MKRFYSAAAVVRDSEGLSIHLDGRAIRTPGRALLTAPTLALAQAIADEWSMQGDEILPATMKLTGIANAAIDLVSSDPVAFAAPLAAYGESDLLIYRAPEADLAARQAAEWNGLLDWAERSYDVEFTLATGVMHVAQSPHTVETLANALAGHDTFTLAALSPIVSIGGSLVAGLALANDPQQAEAIWHAVTLDERWQEERWGEDDDARIAREGRHQDWQAAARFIALLKYQD